MKTMTATEASRSFAALLDDVARGEHVIITRGGRRIAEVGPVAAGNGGLLVDFLLSAPIDVDYASDVAAARAAARAEDPVWLAD